jgi:hypothetical protein
MKKVSMKKVYLLKYLKNLFVPKIRKNIFWPEEEQEQQEEELSLPVLLL